MICSISGWWYYYGSTFFFCSFFCCILNFCSYHLCNEVIILREAHYIIVLYTFITNTFEKKNKGWNIYGMDLKVFQIFLNVYIEFTSRGSQYICFHLNFFVSLKFKFIQKERWFHTILSQCLSLKNVFLFYT